MNTPSPPAQEFRPDIFHPTHNSDELAALLHSGDITVIDELAALNAEARTLRPPPEQDAFESPRWVHYSWRRTMVSLPGPALFRRLRLDRNRNKITSEEQSEFTLLKIGIVGLSVGHAIAHTLALEGLCGEMRLADFDSIELSNLNRIPATVFDLGINKAVAAARRIAELDPYLPVAVFTDGLTESTMTAFFDGLDVVIEECDSLDMKVRIRQEARARGIPVLMETSDRGLFDVERFDLEPDRPLFHGLLGDVDPESLRGLSTVDKAPHVMRILQASQLSSRLAASMVEINRTLSTWPQLGGDVQLGAATMAAAVRRFGRAQPLPSGRIRVDLERDLEALDSLIKTQEAIDPPPAADLSLEVPTDVVDAVIHAIRLAPSGGNAQPWSLRSTGDRVDIDLVPSRTTGMDVNFRGSYVAIGAAAFNARVASAAHQQVATVVPFPEGDGSLQVVSLKLRSGSDPHLAELYPHMVRRISNRNLGSAAALTKHSESSLAQAAASEGATLQLVSDSPRLEQLAEILAESDRFRYLTPLLHQQMMSEIKWPGRDRLDLGIDVRTLGLNAADVAKLEVACRPEVMANLAAWHGGSALGDNTRDRVNASSAMAVVCMPSSTPRDFVQGGGAMQRVWITAEQLGLGVQPVSPVFLYARDDADLHQLSRPFADQLRSLQHQFFELLGLSRGQAPILILRLVHAAGRTRRSERLQLSGVMAP